MLNPFLTNTKQVNENWRELREQLTADLSDNEHLDLVSKFWALAPISHQFLDYDNPATWPTAWELITENNFDESAVAIGMHYTLLLGTDLRWTSDRCKILFVTMKDKSCQKLVLLVDDKLVLNCFYNTIVDYNNSEHFDIVQQYSYINKSYKMIK
jgi:hypothetical protein